MYDLEIRPVLQDGSLGAPQLVATDWLGASPRDERDRDYYWVVPDVAPEETLAGVLADNGWSLPDRLRGGCHVSWVVWAKDRWEDAPSFDEMIAQCVHDLRPLVGSEAGIVAYVDPDADPPGLAWRVEGEDASGPVGPEMPTVEAAQRLLRAVRVAALAEGWIVSEEPDGALVICDPYDGQRVGMDWGCR